MYFSLFSKKIKIVFFSFSFFFFRPFLFAVVLPDLFRSSFLFYTYFENPYFTCFFVHTFESHVGLIDRLTGKIETAFSFKNFFFGGGRASVLFLLFVDMQCNAFFSKTLLFTFF
jgi:hypothetical protein